MKFLRLDDCYNNPVLVNVDDIGAITRVNNITQIYLRREKDSFHLSVKDEIDKIQFKLTQLLTTDVNVF